jgi:hypothetical protein
MRRAPVVLLAIGLLGVGSSVPAWSVESERPTSVGTELAVRQPAKSAATDTVWFGGTHWDPADGRWEANITTADGDLWTFDSGVDSNWEGWTVRDLTLRPPPTLPPGNPDNADFRWTNESLYALYGTPGTDLFPATTPPDTGAIWCSKYEVEADDLCYLEGQGYGGKWAHEARKVFAYGGTGDARLTFKYFNATEKNYDFTYLYLEFNGVRETAPRRTYTGPLGNPTGKRTDILTIPAASIPGGTSEITAVFRFVSDGGWSDEDGGSPTIYGPFCCYDFHYEDLGTPANDDEDTFETGPDGWTFHQKPAVGAFVDLTPADELPEPAVPCDPFSGNVVTFFDKEAAPGAPRHPAGQHAIAVSPVIDLAEAGLADLSDIVVSADAYVDAWWPEGVGVRAWFRVYPVSCPSTGLPMEADVDWVMYDPTYWYLPSPTCFDDEVIDGIPTSGHAFSYLRVTLEVEEYCATITECTSPGGNESPWFDNLRLGVVLQNPVVGADAPPRPTAPALAVLPNPARASVRVEYAVPAAGPVSLRIYSLGGALVKTLVDQAMGAGRFEAEWNGRDDQGRPVAAGVYWARCGAGGRETARRLVLLK